MCIKIGFADFYINMPSNVKKKCMQKIKSQTYSKIMNSNFFKYLQIPYKNIFNNKKNH